MHHLLTKCITKIDRKTKDDAEDLDSVMLMYNLIEYSSSTGSLSFYSRDREMILMLILQTRIILNLASIRLNY